MSDRPRIRSAGPPNKPLDDQKPQPDKDPAMSFSDLDLTFGGSKPPLEPLELSDDELELIATSISITVSTQARKIQRLPKGLVAQAGKELDANEALLRRIRDEQRMRRQTP
jgi:hypothetical protein